MAMARFPPVRQGASRQFAKPQNFRALFLRRRANLAVDLRRIRKPHKSFVRAAAHVRQPIVNPSPRRSVPDAGIVLRRPDPQIFLHPNQSRRRDQAFDLAHAENWNDGGSPAKREVVFPSLGQRIPPRLVSYPRLPDADLRLFAVRQVSLARQPRLRRFLQIGHRPFGEGAAFVLLIEPGEKLVRIPEPFRCAFLDEAGGERDLFGG